MSNERSNLSEGLQVIANGKGRAPTNHVLIVAAIVGASALWAQRASADDTVGVMADGAGLGAALTGSGVTDTRRELAQVDLATGAVTSTLTFDLPVARGRAQPTLSLHYNSQRGVREAGVGWGLDLPVIQRRPLWGAPKYSEAPSIDTGGSLPPGSPLDSLDRFEFSGQPLVPICWIDGNGNCPGGNGEEQAPPGWIYFRAQTEGNFDRFYLSSDFQTWQVRRKNGTVLVLGCSSPGNQNLNGCFGVDTDALTIPPSPFRWKIVEAYDLEGGTTPVNVATYTWNGELTDIHYSTLTSGSRTPAYHVHLKYKLPSYNVVSNAPVWREVSVARLSDVDITSMPFSGSSGPRAMLRRYHLNYIEQQHHSYLASFQVEGRCATDVFENDQELLPSSQCPMLPATTMSYLPPALNTTPTQITFQGSGLRPPQSGQPQNIVAVDVNGDGLADLVQAALASPPGPNPASTTQGLFINDQKNPGVNFNFYGLIPEGSVGDMSNVAPEIMSLGDVPGTYLPHGRSFLGDWTADGSVGVIWSEQPHSDGSPGGALLLRPHAGPVNWTWDSINILDSTGALEIAVPPYGDSSGQVRMLSADVNGDGLLDAITVRAISTLGGIVYQAPVTYLSVRSADGKINPFDVQDTGCDSGTSIRANDQFADINGDGIPDFIDFQGYAQNISYRAGTGYGYDSYGRTETAYGEWAGPCSEGFTQIPAPLPLQNDTQPYQPIFHDLDGDGLADLIYMDANGIKVFLNVDGTRFEDTPFLDVDSTYIDHLNGFSGVDQWSMLTLPANPLDSTDIPYVPSLRVLVADMNGSGTDDLLIVGTNTAYYFDLQANQVGTGELPGVLGTIYNGYGGATGVMYASTTRLYANYQSANVTWNDISPQVEQVAFETWTTNDWNGQQFNRLYAYFDPAYDAWRREFKGFRRVTEVIGSNAETNMMTVYTTFLIHTCQDVPGSCDSTNSDFDLQMSLPPLRTDEEVTTDYGAPSLQLRHWQYRVDQLESGADGRVVRYPYAEQLDTYKYDEDFQTSGFASANVTSLEWDGGDTQQSVTEQITTETSATGPYAHLRSAVVRDGWGNATQLTDYGQIFDNGTPLDPVIQVSYTMEPAAQGLDRGLVASETVLPFSPPRDLPTSQPRTYSYQYDAAGNVTYVYGALIGTLPLDRFHSVPGAQVAPPPTGSSWDHTIQLAHFTYDAYGNVRTHERALGTCVHHDYDQYAQFVVKTTSTSSGGCSGPGTEIGADYSYDRGLQAITLAFDFSGGMYSPTYDGFGRTLTVSETDPDVGGLAQQWQFEYPLSANGQMRTVHATGPTGKESWTYIDGLDETLLTVQRTDASDGSPSGWLASGNPTFGTMGLPEWENMPWYFSSTPTADSFAAITSARGAAPQRHLEYDPFGRLKKVTDFDGTVVLQKYIHSLSEDDWDASDLTAGDPNADTPNTVTVDGHGRRVSVATVMPDGDVITTGYAYQSTGEVAEIFRAHTADSLEYVRWMQYDSLGRMVLNAEPNSSANFSPLPNYAPGLKAWRYAYNDSGDLVGTSDARGCGENIAYDGLRRIVSEDYSPCLGAPQLSYSSAPDVTYIYDAPETGQTVVAGLTGRLAAKYDRASHTQFSYDHRGRMVGIARALRAPLPGPGGVTTYTPTWYRQSVGYDVADQVTSVTTGADQADLMGAIDGQATLSFSRSLRGLVTAVAGSYGTLLQSATYDAFGKPTNRVFGDVANTQDSYGYDTVERPTIHAVTRAAPGIWSTGAPGYAPPTDGSTTQTELVDTLTFYDPVSNPKQIADVRDPSVWSPGAKPTSQTIKYDGIYRAKEIDYDSRGDVQALPFTLAEETSGAPVPSTILGNRVAQQTFAYDFMGNTTQTDDDTHDTLYDRSLGAVVNGDAAGHPNQITSFGGSTSPQATYDAAGNLVNLVIQRPSATCSSPEGCVQRYVYDWDETGHLAQARRWDYATLPANDPTYPAVPTAQPSWTLLYEYDSSGQRIWKEVDDTTPNNGKITAQIFDTLRLESTSFNGTDYLRDHTFEVVYLAGLGRVFYDNTGGNNGPTLPTVTGSRVHVFLEFSDAIGSTTTVIDKDSSELVERASYTGYGSADSDYRPTRWGSFREAYRYSGKEDDIQAGLTYFGARYYQSSLGRWLSPDPLTIHGGGGDLNPYAFVNGSPLRYSDPFGLQGMEGSQPVGNNCDDPDCASGGGPGGIGGFLNGIVQFFSDPFSGLFGGGGGGSAGPPSAPSRPQAPPLPASPPSIGLFGADLSTTSPTSGGGVASQWDSFNLGIAHGALGLLAETPVVPMLGAPSYGELPGIGSLLASGQSWLGAHQGNGPGFDLGKGVAAIVPFLDPEIGVEEAADKGLQSVSRNLSSELRASDKAVEHVLEGHSSGSTIPGKGRFGADVDITQTIKDTVDYGKVRPNTNGRAGQIFELPSVSPVGTNGAGDAAYWTRVVVGPTGLITAFPF